MPDYDDIYRRAFADALVQNLQGEQLANLSPKESETAVAYAREYAEAEVEAARALAATGPGTRPDRELLIGGTEVHVCGLCAALTLAAPTDQKQHARYHIAFDRPADEQGDQQ
jgi:hypothetical protein